MISASYCDGATGMKKCLRLSASSVNALLRRINIGGTWVPDFALLYTLRTVEGSTALKVASHINQSVENCSVLLLTDLPVMGRLRLPRGVDYVHLPTMAEKQTEDTQGLLWLSLSFSF